MYQLMATFNHLLFVGYGLVFLLIVSCNTIRTGISGKKNPHEQYSNRLQTAGFDRSPFGSLWLSAADKSLVQPVAVNIPYKERGYFAADKPAAYGYKFAAKRGEKIVVTVNTVPATGFQFFIDLWQQATEGQPRMLAYMDTATRSISYEAEEDGQYILRLQTELLWNVEYTVNISNAPSLAFPVSGSAKPTVSSFWGADRDAGARSHEGIDIFAKKRTPAIAAADGYVTRVNENTLGGKVVFMRPEGKEYSLYYAHLDTQLVSSGQRVKQGDVLGLIGNTGNARTTPAHLHFGIYATGGAIDPYPFVNVNRKPAEEITASLSTLNKYVRNTAVATVTDQPAKAGSTSIKIPADEIMKVVGITGKMYKVVTPDEQQAFIASELVTEKPMRSFFLAKETRLLGQPDSAAAAITILAKGTTVSIAGNYGRYYYAKNGSLNGWIEK